MNNYIRMDVRYVLDHQCRNFNSQNKDMCEYLHIT